VKRLKLRPLVGSSNLLHLWGPAGSGKTLLATSLAAEASRSGIVEWINTDGKRGFIPILRTNTAAVGGIFSNIRVTFAQGPAEARTAVMQTPETTHTGTRMVVVDSVTRVLDMSKVDDIMWGRELLEEALPSLAALAEKGIVIVLTSEVRSTEVGVVPVLHDSVGSWKPMTLRAARGPGRHSTLFLPTPEGEEVFAVLKVNERGFVQLDYPNAAQLLGEGDQTCLERQSCV
jgi:hypothetical protein